MNENYRHGIGAVILNQDNLIFAGSRVDSLDAKYMWQMPQGGIDENEAIEDCLARELYEETGIENYTIIQKTGWLKYDLPKDIAKNFWQGKYRGQKQIWFLLQFTGSESEIRLDLDHREFSEWRWCERDFLIENIIPFKRELYENILLKQFKL